METLSEELKTVVTSVVKHSMAWKREEENKMTVANKEFLNQRIHCALTAFASPWFRSLIDYDPRLALEKVKYPVLLIFCELDMQVTVEENRNAMVNALQKSSSIDFTVKTFPRANHLFQAAKTGSPSEYLELEKKFVPGFLEFISDWILEHLRTIE